MLFVVLKFTQGLLSEVEGTLDLDDLDDPADRTLYNVLEIAGADDLTVAGIATTFEGDGVMGLTVILQKET